MRGGVLIAAVSVGNRLSSLVAQLFLGRLLFEEDFGLFAIALGLTSIGGALRSVLQPVLIGHLEDDSVAFGRAYRTVMFSIVAFSALGVAASGPIGGALDEPDLQPLLIAMMVLIPLVVLPVFGHARMSHELRFGVVSKALTMGGFARHGVTVLCAFMGFGAFSFAFGVFASVLVELVALRPHTDIFVRPGLISIQTSVDVRGAVKRAAITADRRFIWLGAAALSFSTTGDYTAASIWASTAIIGLYYFAYTLTGSFHQPISLAANTVLVPAFVGLKNDQERGERFVETVELLCVLGGLLFGALAVTIVPLTDLMWAGKWNDAGPALLGFTLFAPIQALYPVNLAIERGCGYWALYFSDILLAGSATVVAAALGAWAGGLGTIVIAVVTVKVAITYVSLYRLSLRFGSSFVEIAWAVTRPWLLFMVALGIAHLVHPLNDPELRGSLLRLPVAALMGFTLLVVPYRSLLRGIIESATRKDQ